VVRTPAVFVKVNEYHVREYSRIWLKLDYWSFIRKHALIKSRNKHENLNPNLELLEPAYDFCDLGATFQPQIDLGIKQFESLIMLFLCFFTISKINPKS